MHAGLICMLRLSAPGSGSHPVPGPQYAFSIKSPAPGTWEPPATPVIRYGLCPALTAIAPAREEGGGVQLGSSVAGGEAKRGKGKQIDVWTSPTGSWYRG